MTNYYDILGLTRAATIAEIKAAFRTLAKLYHPDKNPEGQEHFKKILRAYETLSDPSRKSSYDLRLKYHSESAHTHQSARGKNWSFEEKELKRRQYYNDHIKKYEKVKKARTEHAQLKTNYNEYKYILYATPVAVALFLLVIHFATPSRKSNNITPAENLNSKTELKTGDVLYTDYFGSPLYVPGTGKSLTIKNSTGQDIIVCLFSVHGFLRSCVIKEGYYAEIPQLPAKPIEIRYESGTNWDPSENITGVNFKGAFEKNLHFFRSNTSVTPGAINELTLLPGINEGFETATPAGFFKKESI